MSLLKDPADATLKACEAEEMILAKKIAMVNPMYFDLKYAINPHMKDDAGNMHSVDRDVALGQWQELKGAYESLGFEVVVWDGEPGFPDMVFCANQSLPYIDQQGRPSALMSRMASAPRSGEVPFIESNLQSMSIQTNKLTVSDHPELYFEGTGDALWVPGRRLILGGYGFRTHQSVYEDVGRIVNSPIALFELRNPKFYHLDTCLSILSDTTVLACREAYTETGWNLLSCLFEDVIEVSVEESDSPGFACNAHCPDGKHVLIQKGNRQCLAQLNERGFIPIELNTDQFILSGGSVFCLKLVCF
ncbi:MAG: amidinotransferase [Pseudobacteriovorax sp.]|nr:amidinotransferase [Pseudobacteriovorax sp.]